MQSWILLIAHNPLESLKHLKFLVQEDLSLSGTEDDATLRKDESGSNNME